MTQAAQGRADAPLLLPDLLAACRAGLDAAEKLVADVRKAVAQQAEGRDGLEREQFAGHGLAWVATYAAALRQTLAWAERLDASGRLGELEQLIAQAAFGEYLAQLSGGLPMSQGEIVRLADLGVGYEATGVFSNDAVWALIRGGNTAAVRMRIASLIGDGHFGDPAMDDDTLDLVRDQFRKVAEDHRADAHE